MTRRSDCPISNVLDLVGDKWSLLILRDLLFFNKKSYSDLQNSDEKVASNILSNRLEKLELSGLIAKQPDEKDKRKKIYTLTEKGMDMLPILLDMILWSAKYSPDTNIPVALVDRASDDRNGLLEELRNQVAF
ncbi:MULTISPECIES: winged helix-turn-helix transcriptional regulator [Pseudoalteromonas]|uniref:winged helix-turn-helix transcriptional regulator n=1 Tax=Pseudoalteromonas TaxID=53246 RepID=UPI00029A1C56|nr:MULTISPECIES: helix-turn-helix domain-containing protein [Pseudoalteromonas]QZO15203.1 helix-turn-helix transcriptional regulator [Pseudoalteromonas piscicida]WMO15883.1 helix-turn-helix transcriptional regulator [Pseudoalteromonas piscicida]